MKYTFLFNQAGIVDAGMSDKTDFNDWAILEYVAEWQVHGSARMENGHVWLNYRHLLDEMPMLSVRSKNGLSDRLKKLRGLGLLSSFQSEGNALFVKVTDLYSSVVRFRGEPRRHDDAEVVLPDEHGCSPQRTGVRPSEQGVRPSEQGCSSQRTHIINNHRINNQEQTKLFAGACAREDFSDEQVFDQPLQWAQFFIRECDYPLHIVQTAKTIPMFADWVKQQITVGDMREAMAACHGWNADRIPDSPVLYRKFLQSILDERKRLAEEELFSQRPGVGRNRAIEDWAKVPKADDDLWPWAKKHGYPGPGSKTYREYRSLLYAQVDKRRADHGGGRSDGRNRAH